MPDDITGLEIADIDGSAVSPTGDAVESAEEAIAEAEAGDASPEEIAQLRKDLAIAKRSAATLKGLAQKKDTELANRDAQIAEALREVGELKQWRQQQQVQSSQSAAQAEDRQFEAALEQYGRDLEQEGYAAKQIDRLIKAERFGYSLTRQKADLDRRETEILQRYGTDISSAKALAYAERLAAQTVSAAKKRGVTIDVSVAEILAKTKEVLGRPPQDEREIEAVRVEMLMDKMLEVNKSSKAATRTRNLQADADNGTYEQETTGVADMSEKAIIDAFTDGSDDPRIIDAYTKLRQKRGLSYI